MKQKIEKLDFERFAQPEYPHREACEILGVKGNVLQIWNKRFLGHEPSPTSERRRGRKYSVTDLILLTAFKRLAPYFGAAVGIRLAATCVPLVLGQFWMHGAAETDAELAQTDGRTFIVIFEKDGEHGVDLVAPHLEAPNRNVEEWIRHHGSNDWIDNFVAISIHHLTMGVFARIELAEEKRGA